jgi:pimeloyl-ACP methyl ester carboxylesterase
VPEIEFKGRRASYRTWGEGPPIVFLHSGGSHGGQWTKVVEALGPGRSAIAPDLLGFGATEPWPVAGGLSHDLQAELVAQIIDSVVGRPVDIVGHSYGGSVAIRLAVNRPEKVRSLVLIEPIVNCLLAETGDPLFEESERVNRFLVACIERGDPASGWQAFIDSRNGPGTWEKLSDRRRQEFLDQSAQAREAVLSNLNNRTTLAECGAISAPITVACGGATSAPDRRVSEILRDATDARYEVIAGAGHMSPLSHPAEVARIVRDHMAVCRSLGMT